MPAYSNYDTARILVWFSCGASSAVAAKLAVNQYPTKAEVLYCNTLKTEHLDNHRFFDQVQDWIGREIKIITSSKYRDIDDVFMSTRYMAGIKGARCTVEMKKAPRNDYQQANDTHIFGLTADEPRRIDRFVKQNPELHLNWLLRDLGITKDHCIWMLNKALIQPPIMYDLGFDHNNCLGCVKATSPAYWQRVARHFPEIYKRRCKQSRELKVKLVRVDGVRIFLDKLDLNRRYKGGDGDIECGPYCSSPTGKSK